jgi:hypothetical protein
MKRRPDWLPALASVSGVWEVMLKRLYRIFEADFKHKGCTLGGRPLRWDSRILTGERYEEGFWHLITQTDQNTKERLFDPRRAERLPWCAPTIMNAHDSAVLMWDYLEARNRLRTYLWLKDWDYVIVLEKKPHRRGEVAFLITAYYVSGQSTRKNLQRKYDKRVLQ